MNKKGWLDKLYYQIGKQNVDYELNIMKKEDGVTKSTKWKKYSEVCFPIDQAGHCDDLHTWAFFNRCNNRSIFPNEIVLDLEDPDQFDNLKFALDAYQFKYYAFKTGSKGYHFHLFFDEDLIEAEKVLLINRFGCDAQKASKRCMIALEFTPHWKTGNTKSLINPKVLPSEIELNKKEKIYELQEQITEEVPEQESD